MDCSTPGFLDPPRLCSISCSFHWWWCPVISSKALFFFCSPSFPASGILPMSLLFTSDAQNTGASALASVLPVNIQGSYPLRLTGLISLLSKTFRRIFQHHSSKATIFWHSAFFTVQLWHPYMINGKTIALTIWTFVSKVMSLIFNTLSRFVITFLPRSNRLLISWLQSPSAVILEPKRRKSVTTFTFSPSICNTNRCQMPWS